MENISKNSLLIHSQGVSLSIADAKVDTFRELAKLYRKFFVRFFKKKLQKADYQQKQGMKNFDKTTIFGKYMLQNMVPDIFSSYDNDKERCLCPCFYLIS